MDNKNEVFIIFLIFNFLYLYIKDIETDRNIIKKREKRIRI